METPRPTTSAFSKRTSLKDAVTDPSFRQSHPDLNPFVNDSFTHMAPKTKLKLALGFLLFFLPRLLLLLVLLFINFIINVIATTGLPPPPKDRPPQLLDPWRRSLLKYSQKLVRPLLFCFGFTSIHIHGNPATAAEAPIIVVGPHSTVLDWAPVVWTNWCAFVSASSNIKYPVIGRALISLQCILVDRFDKDSKHKTINEITRRAKSKGQWSQVIMFPEGTTANGSCLMTFKVGAFLPGVPVQPVALRFLCDGFNPGWTGDASIPKLMLAFMSQWSATIHAYYLPPHVPTQQEQKDPGLFAENVKTEIAAVLRIPCTDHAIEDMLLQMSAKKKGLPSEIGVVEFELVKKELGLDLARTKQLLDDFANIDADRSGKISLAEFAKYLKLPAQGTLVKELFQRYDQDHDQNISFREFLAGFCLITAPELNDDLMHSAYAVLDVEKNGKVKQDVFCSFLESVLVRQGVSIDECANIAVEIFHDTDTDKNGAVSYEEFQALVKSRPMYANLLKSSMAASESQLVEF